MNKTKRKTEMKCTFDVFGSGESGVSDDAAGSIIDFSGGSEESLGSFALSVGEKANEHNLGGISEGLMRRNIK